MFLFHLKNSLRSQDISIFVMTFPSCRKTAEPIKCQCCPHIETSQLICFADQLTGFNMRTTLELNGLNEVFTTEQIFLRARNFLYLYPILFIYFNCIPSRKLSRDSFQFIFFALCKQNTTRNVIED